MVPKTFKQLTTDELHIVNTFDTFFKNETGFRSISEKELALVVKKLNTRPRKCLSYQTPHEVYCQALRGAL